MGAPPEEQILGFPRGLRVQVGDNGRRLSLDGNDGLAGMIRWAMRGGLINKDLEDVNMSPFIPRIRQARNALEFKLSTLKTYDGKTDPVVHLTIYMRHMEVLGASKEVMTRCFPLYLTDIATL